MMKQLLMVVLLGSAPYWMSAIVQAETDRIEADTPSVMVLQRGDNPVVFSTGDCEGSVSAFAVGADTGVVLVTIDGKSDARAYATSMANGADDGAEGLVHRIVLKVVDEDDGGGGHSVRVLRRTWSSVGDGGEDRGWLGVSIGKLSATIAKQFDLAEQGVVVLNVMEESPAAKAGFEAHDIILSVDGEMVTAGVAKTIELVGSHEPGDVVTVIVLRDGDEQPITVELAARPAMNKFQWKFDFPPFAELEEEITTRGRMLHRDDDGNWTVHDLGELSNIPGILKLLPHGLHRTAQVWVDGNRRNIKLKQEKDGTVLMIAREGDGEIKVTRIDEDGEETSSTYEDEEELAEADEEAADLYQRSGKPMTIHLNLQGLGDLDFDFDFDVDLEKLEGDLFEWQADLEGHLSEATEAYRNAMEQAREAYENFGEHWRQDGDDGRSEPFRALPFGMFMPKSGDSHAFFGRKLKPKHSFEVNENGQIEVRIRKGDSELVRLYEDADDLADRNPKLFEKYQELTELDEDE